jgi:amylosucrase
MDWVAAGRRHDPGSVEGRLWHGLRRLVEARTTTRAVHAHGLVEPIWTFNEHVFGLWREHAGQRMLLLANFSESPQTVPLALGTSALGLDSDAVGDGAPMQTRHDLLHLVPYQYAWLRA